VYEAETRGRVQTHRAATDEFRRVDPSFSLMAVPAPDALSFAIRGPIARADLPGLCERVCALLEANESPLAFCDVAGVAVDAVTVDALARLQLAAHRQGCRIRLVHASAELLALVRFMGLEDVLPD
jgi:ABC-type transporter Mla MlaB component